MTKNFSALLTTAAMAAALSFASLAHAQNAQNGPPKGPPGSGNPPSEHASAVPGGPLAPVLAVTAVEVMRSALPGGMDIVRARGVVTSGAWGAPQLIPITRGPSADGMLDFVFVASAPEAGAQPGPFMPMETLLPIAAGNPYKGIRVRGATNVVALKALPGLAEAAVPKADCAQCIGKVFAFKGATNVPADAIREESLPWQLRIIKVNEGIPSFDVNPNRLSLLLGDDNKIVAALWE